MRPPVRPIGDQARETPAAVKSGSSLPPQVSLILPSAAFVSVSLTWDWAEESVGWTWGRRLGTPLWGEAHPPPGAAQGGGQRLRGPQGWGLC